MLVLPRMDAPASFSLLTMSASVAATLFLSCGKLTVVLSSCQIERLFDRHRDAVQRTAYDVVDQVIVALAGGSYRIGLIADHDCVEGGIVPVNPLDIELRQRPA